MLDKAEMMVILLPRRAAAGAEKWAALDGEGAAESSSAKLWLRQRVVDSFQGISVKKLIRGLQWIEWLSLNGFSA